MGELETALGAIDRYLGAGSPPPVEECFADSFLAQIPAPSLERVLAGMIDQMGACTEHRILERSSPRSAKVRWTFERGYTVEGSIGVSEPPAPKIRKSSTMRRYQYGNMSRTAGDRCAPDV